MRRARRIVRQATSPETARIALLHVLATCIVVGCGYHSISNYLPHIDSVRIPPVVNVTVLVEIEDELTTRFQERFRVKWNSGDDSLLRLWAHDYWIQPRQYDVNNLPEQYRMSVQVDYQFWDNVRQRMIREAQDQEFHRDFYVVTGHGEEPEDEETARANLFDDLVDTLYYTLAEQW